MKQLRFSSFRQRLNAAFLAVSLVPVLLCSALLLQIFRLRMTADQQQNAGQQLDGACHALFSMQEGLQEAAITLGGSETVLGALSGGWENSASVYSALYDATEDVRRFARFELYDAEGTLMYATQTVHGAQTLPVSWGILKEAADRDTIVYSASIDPTDLDEPVLRGAVRLTAQNYYDENGAELDIPLDPLLTPQQNAAKYYKRYTKAKTAEKHLREQIDKAIGERDYLESVQGEIALAQTEAEFAELRRELQETGYLRRSGKEKKGREKPIAPREFRSSSGLRILVGRSNVQNDALTRKADKRDLWLHTQKIHGSHVILCTEDGAYDDESLHEAALLAAYYSQAQGGSNVPVDYTSVKYVKKPAGARPGMVVYETYRTLYVTPDEETIRRLDRKNK